MNFSYEKIREIYKVKADGHRLGLVGVELDEDPPKAWLSLDAGIMLDTVTLQQLLDLLHTLPPEPRRVL